MSAQQEEQHQQQPQAPEHPAFNPKIPSAIPGNVFAVCDAIVKGHSPPAAVYSNNASTAAINAHVIKGQPVCAQLGFHNAKQLQPDEVIAYLKSHLSANPKPGDLTRALKAIGMLPASHP